MLRNFIALTVLALAGCTAARPTISDPSELVKECRPLFSEPSSTLDPKDWPPAVQQLAPIEVRVDKGVVVITTFRQTGVGARGYIVSDRAPALDHYATSPGAVADLYLFNFRP